MRELGIDLGSLLARKEDETFVTSIGGVPHCARLHAAASGGRNVLTIRLSPPPGSATDQLGVEKV